MRILWATNAAAPYRLPVWDALASSHTLDVLLLEDDSKMADGTLNRGADWISHAESSYSVSKRRTWTFSRGEARYYVLPPTFSRSPLTSADVVLLGGWESPAYWQLLAQAKTRRIRTVGFYESTRLSQQFVGGAIGTARATFFRRLDAVVVPGPAAERAVKDMGVAPEKISVGFNAVDVQGIHAAALAARESIGEVSTPGHRFLCVAQLITRKNLSSLIEAFAAIRQPADTLTIVGKGPLESGLRGLASGLPVQFEGHVPYGELPELLVRHHTLVLPSTEEVWGLVVNEALAAGLHVVVSDRCGVVDSVRGMKGVFVCPTDAVSIGGAMDASRRLWRGPIDNPSILAHGPEQFAATFESAMRSE